MAVVGFVPHQLRPEAVALAESAAAWLEGNGHDARVLGHGDRRWACERTELAAGLDLAVSLGGDGTMLRTVDLIGDAGVPVLGVNVGHLGYLTEVEPGGLRCALRRFLDGDYTLDQRMTLQVSITSAFNAEANGRLNALNDAVLQRVPSGHAVRLAMSVNGEPFLTYAADSMIVATPTGSTAYSLSARGPIASPRTRVLLVTPVAAHMLFDRSLVYSDQDEVALEVIDGREAELFVDGESRGMLATGDVVRCRAGGHDAKLVTFGERHFHHILKQKFGLTDR